MTIILYGMASGFLVTRGYGDESVEPPPTPPADGTQDTILGIADGGLFASTHLMVGLGVQDDV